MKIIPEQSTGLMEQARPRIRVDKGAYCFFFLGVFLAAFIFHFTNLIPAF
ncbi:MULTISPECIES: hypothetical protein [unclassified Acinetobacter]|nr:MULTISPECIES: hypothetical protein [unclassified Acinetobacter]SEL21737.1 hypothetical protein SAMN05216500_10188 [Acinetobacter sp. DSM 11652]